MEFSVGAIVRLRSGVSEDDFRKEGLSGFRDGIALEVVQRGKYRPYGRRYRVSTGFVDAWWMPGDWLKPIHRCMFNKED